MQIQATLDGWLNYVPLEITLMVFPDCVNYVGDPEILVNTFYTETARTFNIGRYTAADMDQWTIQPTVLLPDFVADPSLCPLTLYLDTPNL